MKTFIQLNVHGLLNATSNEKTFIQTTLVNQLLDNLVSSVLYVHSYMLSMIKFSITHWCVTRPEMI